MSKRKLDDRLEEGCSCVLGLCDRGAGGAVNEATVIHQLKQSGYSPEEIAQVTNHLLSSSAVAIYHDPGTGQKLLKRQTADQQAKEILQAGLGDEELLVLQRVTEAKNQGVWKKTLKIATGLKQGKIFEKALKTLLREGLIKEVCTKDGPKKKTFMLAELDPPASVTGWPWHDQDGVMNVLFIDKLHASIIDLVRRNRRATLNEMHAHIKAAGIEHSAELTKDHVRSIVDVLLNDNKIELMPSDLASEEAFRPARLHTESAGIGVMAVPCGVCPVASQCKPGGLVSPTTCEYLDKWLDF